ncbi:lithostathine-1-beta-like [Betta splendens]|uniref:Lithostathine-1-beta-like n=1 Tax=Betta splendens TaxID=158456 RepID=A0A9W2Y8H4_BETSP|nr:lithostathine-1-beta-like [Betta splendens]
MCDHECLCFYMLGSTPTGSSSSGSCSCSCSNDAGLQFYDDPRSWFEALGFCRAQKQKLVEISNDTVMNNVIKLQQNETVTQNGVWVGLERPIFGIDSTWRWISGGSVNTSQWNSSSPPSSTNKYCGKIIWVNETRTIKLLDDDCFNELPFICQEERRMQTGGLDVCVTETE